MYSRAFFEDLLFLWIVVFTVGHDDKLFVLQEGAACLCAVLACYLLLCLVTFCHSYSEPTDFTLFILQTIADPEYIWL